MLPLVTPKRLLDLGGGAVNELSYQQARNNRAAVGQTYVAEPGEHRTSTFCWTVGQGRMGRAARPLEWWRTVQRGLLPCRLPAACLHSMLGRSP